MWCTTSLTICVLDKQAKGSESEHSDIVGKSNNFTQLIKATNLDKPAVANPFPTR